MGKLGDRIKEIRLKEGMSQEAFARELGYTSKSTINKIEKGISGTDEESRAKKVEAAYQKASYAKAGSITAKANMVRDFDERNKKK